MSEYFTVERNPDLIDREVVERIRADIENLAKWYEEHDEEDVANIILTDVMGIFDKHLKGEEE